MPAMIISRLYTRIADDIEVITDGIVIDKVAGHTARRQAHLSGVGSALQATCVESAFSGASRLADGTVAHKSQAVSAHRRSRPAIFKRLAARQIASSNQSIEVVTIADRCTDLEIAHPASTGAPQPLLGNTSHCATSRGPVRAISGIPFSARQWRSYRPPGTAVGPLPLAITAVKIDSSFEKPASNQPAENRVQCAPGKSPSKPSSALAFQLRRIPAGRRPR